MYLVLLGPPGTGKGTQAKRIAERTGLAHVSTGDLFRQAVAKGTELGRRAKEYMDRGDLVPDELTIAMLEERIQQPDAQQGVLFDGYPRTLEQARALSRALDRRNATVDAALHVGASDDEIVRRLSGRWLCGSCGEIYHEQHRPPKEAKVCDACGCPLAQRDDDRPEVVRERLRRQRPPQELLAYYRDRGKLVEINGEQDIDAVTNDLLAAIEAS
ncbi:MAG: adenylate kinase [Chloroflexi bacterium]|nr:adenylate kinase [Chloroflexota bacterium]